MKVKYHFLLFSLIATTLAIASFAQSQTLTGMPARVLEALYDRQDEEIISANDVVQLIKGDPGIPKRVMHWHYQRPNEGDQFEITYLEDRLKMDIWKAYSPTRIRDMRGNALFYLWADITNDRFTWVEPGVSSIDYKDRDDAVVVSKGVHIQLARIESKKKEWDVYYPLSGIVDKFNNTLFHLWHEDESEAVAQVGIAAIHYRDADGEIVLSAGSHIQLIRRENDTWNVYAYPRILNREGNFLFYLWHEDESEAIARPSTGVIDYKDADGKIILGSGNSVQLIRSEQKKWYVYLLTASIDDEGKRAFYLWREGDATAIVQPNKSAMPSAD